MIVRPIAPRHYSENIGDRLIISIPSRKNWFVIIFVGVWLVFWVFSEIFVGWIFLQGIMNQNLKAQFCSFSFGLQFGHLVVHLQFTPFSGNLLEKNKLSRKYSKGIRSIGSNT